MGAIQEFATNLITGVNALKTAFAPKVIKLRHPPGHAGAGLETGAQLVWNGASYQKIGQEIGRIEAQADIEIGHTFRDLTSIKTYCQQEERPGDWFMWERADFGSVRLVRFEDKEPELGQVTLDFNRHPAFRKWHHRFDDAQRDTIDIGHEDFADLLLDNREDLDDPHVASAVAAFRAARSIEYSSELDTSNSIGLKVSWKGGADGAVTNAPVPRNFTVNLPAFCGAWTPGEEPRHVAEFRLRVIPPRDKTGAAPLFRLTWANLAEFEMVAIETLRKAVTERVGEKVYLCTPRSRRYVSPRYRGDNLLPTEE